MKRNFQKSEREIQGLAHEIITRNVTLNRDFACLRVEWKHAKIHKAVISDCQSFG